MLWVLAILCNLIGQRLTDSWNLCKTLLVGNLFNILSQRRNRISRFKICTDFKDKLAFNLKLFDGAYHELQQNDYSRLTGSYDVGDAHFVHVELDMDRSQYSICIDNEAIVSNQQFLDGDYANVLSLQFFAPATTTEAFPSEYVVDDIRVTK